MSQRSKPRTGRKNKTQPRKGNGRAAPPTPPHGGTNGKGDVAGNDFSSLLAMGRQTAKSAPEVRSDLVTYYRRLISEGRYSPDTLKVAERMIRKGLLRDL